MLLRKAISFNNRLPLSYWILAFLRVALTLVPQTGYLHPDEFFQNVEVIAGDLFAVSHVKVWEFKKTFPLRNMFAPIMIFGPPLYSIHLMDPYTKRYLGITLRSPYYLLVFPRLFVCLLSFINDYCLYTISVLHGHNFRNKLVVFASSYVVLVYCCRNFSNALEMIFFSVLLLIVSKCMLRFDKLVQVLNEDATGLAVEKVELLKPMDPGHPLDNVGSLSTLVVVGIFSRPTFVGFALPSICFWLLCCSGFKEMYFRVFTLFFCGLPSVLVLLLVDSVYYDSLPSCDSMLSWNWVVTPLNFVRYNMCETNLMKHGVHPRWLHLVGNMPLLFIHLAGAAYVTLSINAYKLIRGHYGTWPRIQSISSLMLSSLVVPLAMLSLCPHQEARFITPVLVPLVYLYGDTLHPHLSKHRLLKTTLLRTWFFLNACLTIFYGFVHQGGIYPLAETLYREIKSSGDVDFHIVITHSYSLPGYLLQLENLQKLNISSLTRRDYTKPKNYIYEYRSTPLDISFTKIHNILIEADKDLHEYKKRYRLYVVSPCSLESEVEVEASNYYSFKLVEDFRFYPHFSSEAPPIFPSCRDQFCFETNLMKTNESRVMDMHMLQRIFCYFKKFCLKVYRVKPNEHL